MKLYRVIDLQGCSFMDDTWKSPMTLNALRSRFWSLDDAGTPKFSQFTKNFIEDMWEVKLEAV